MVSQIKQGGIHHALVMGFDCRCDYRCHRRCHYEQRSVITVAFAVLIFLPLLLRDTLITLDLFVGIAIVVLMFIASKMLERFV